MDTSKRKKPKFITIYPMHNSFVLGSRSLNSIKLLALLCDKISFGCMNCIYVKQNWLVKEMQCSQPNVSRLVGLLIKSKAIKKITNGYMINPKFAFVGSETEREVAIVRWYKS